MRSKRLRQLSVCSLASAVLLAATVERAVAAVLFAAPYLSLDTGTAANGFAVSDLNGDAKPDVVVSRPASNNVSVYLGLGDGTFQPSILLGATGGPRCVTIGDVNGDGLEDLVTGDNTSAMVSIFLGYGDGTFAPHVDFPVAAGPFSVAIADCNGDGRPDLAVGGFGSPQSTVSVLLGNGDGTFGAGQVVFTTGVLQQKVLAADFNGDGRQDVVAFSWMPAGKVYILMGQEDGTLVLSNSYSIPHVYSGAIRDVNADGRPDLVTVSPDNGNQVSVLLGKGDGTFTTGPAYFVYGATSVSVLELNADGKPDLFVSSGSQSGVMLGHGDGSFAPLIPYLVAYGANLSSDVNGDGRTDVLIQSAGSSAVSVLLGNGDGTLGKTLQELLPFSFSFPQALALGDLDLDGQEDLVLCGFSFVSFWLGRGDGTFISSSPIQAVDLPYRVAVGDVNGDGKPDVASANVQNHPVSVWLGNGDGTFGSQTHFGSGGNAFGIVIADLNHDGYADVAVAAHDSSAIQVFLGGGAGLGASRSFSTGLGPRSIAVGDLSGDGVADLVTANDDHTASVLTGNGDGTFAPRIDWSVAGVPTSAAIGEVTGDGIPDLVVAKDGPPGIVVFQGRGSGAFGTTTEFPSRKYPTSVAVRDLDGDHWSEVVLMNNDATVSILNGQAGGGFAPRVDYGLGTGESSVLALGDVNGDGRPDLAGMLNGSHVYSVILNATSNPPTGLEPFTIDQPLSLRAWETPGGGPVRIRYAFSGAPAPARLAVYDVRGRMVWMRSVGIRNSSVQEETWNGRGLNGTLLSRGLYLVRLQARGETTASKLLLMHR